MAQNKRPEIQPTGLPGERQQVYTRLERQNFDLPSVRIQMIIGMTLVFAVCLFAYHPSMGIGFLLDDFLHVDYAARAFAGDSHDLFANLTSNWAGSDLMKSYRPLVSLSFAVDYLLWHANAFGYHLTNIIILMSCCLFVALITLELTGKEGNRLLASPAIWAALLFAVYPLHPEAAAWIVGRVDLLCTLFYLASIFFFLRYQQILEKQYLVFSIVAFALSILSKEMAVTLPVVVTGGAILLQPTAPPRHPPLKPGEHLTLSYIFKQVLLLAKLTWAYWATLAVIAFIRSQFLGTLIGGYGESDLWTLVVSFRTFLDRPSLFKVIVPGSEEMHMTNQVLRACGAFFAAAICVGVIRVIICRSNFRPVVFLLFWCAVALIPTFQIWHIYPNLVGSRLFFLSSAPLCMFLALMALPATEVITKRAAAIFAGVGALTLSGIFLLWTFCLQENLQPWVDAGSRMSFLAEQLDEISQHSGGHQVSIMALPTDYKGAGMITRTLYLNLLLKPPFHSHDISKTFQSADLIGANTSGRSLAENMHNLALNPLDYTWDDGAGRFIKWHNSTGLDHFVQQFSASNSSTFSIAPADVGKVNGDDWHVRSKDAPYVEQDQDFLRIYPGERQGDITVSAQLSRPINPLEAQQVVVHCRYHDRDIQLFAEEPNRPVKLSVCWKSTRGGEQVFEKPLDYLANDLYIASVGDSAEWSQGGDITSLGIKSQTGNYVVDIYSMKAGFVSSAGPKIPIRKSN